MRLRDDHAFEQHKARVSAILDDLGDVRVEDSGRRDSTRHFEAEVEAPRPPLTARARFRYLEWWVRDGHGWRRTKYQYDYIDLIEPGGRLAYHRHDLPGAQDVLHSHCKAAGIPPPVPHFRAYEVDLLEAHEEFAAVYASGRAIECAGLRPLMATQKGTDP
jgi:hypothetical protein